MNKIISTSDRLFMAACGPSCCGKTELIFSSDIPNVTEKHLLPKI